MQYHFPIDPTINPFLVGGATVREHIPEYALLPQAPVTGSPVPRLTSLYHHAEPGDYGSRGYPGNCGGHLIRDLLLYFQPASVFDPMTGSGTCRDVCRELSIPCSSQDIHAGFDACDSREFAGPKPRFNPASFDFVWLHPPYWRQKLYAQDPRDLSRATTLQDFLARYEMLLANCTSVLKPGGTMAVLMGDYTDQAAGFVPLTYHTKRLAFSCGLRQPCTDIIRFGHGASSGRKVYRSSFIPGLHDVCSLFQKPPR